MNCALWAKSVKTGVSVGFCYTLFFYKNIVFPAQAEYSYFSTDFRLKIFLYYSVLEFIGVSIASVW